MPLSPHFGLRIAECGIEKIGPKSLPTGRQANSAMERVYYGMIDLPNAKFDY